LNATFGNAVELILGMIALKQGLIRVVQGNYLYGACVNVYISSLFILLLFSHSASILGSILSNILLVCHINHFL
jgi:hypothetical protein